MVTADQNVTLKYAQTRARKSSHLLELIVTAFLFVFVLDEPISIAAAEIAYTGAALVWLAKVILVRRGVLQRSPLDMPILVYWLLCAASTIVAPLPASRWEGMRKI